MSIFNNIPVKMKTQKNYKQENNIRKLFLYEAQAIDFICVAILLHKKWGRGGNNLMTYRRQW